LSIAIISDVHIRENDDQACKLFEKFCNNEIVRSADTIVLLGDIFDVLIGHHQQYFDIYTNFLKNILTLLNNNNQVFYIEGNHDFHIVDLFNERFSQYSNFFISSKSIKIENEGKIILLAHGDDIDFSNYTYQLYRKIIKSNIVRLFAKSFMSADQILKVGFSHSTTDKKIKSYEQYDKNNDREKFRNAAKRVLNRRKDIDYLICGHSHIQDNIEFDKKKYLNNGFPLADKTFLFISNEKVQFIDL